jgi:purine-binding chemotaxis protein CheW
MILKNKEESKMEYITFNLHNTEYALELTKTREILSYPENITPLPNSSKEMKGLINLRGEVVPIIDLRIKFDIAPEELYNSDTVVLSVKTNDGRMLGIVADKVNDTKDLDFDTIKLIDSLGTTIPVNYIKGVVQHKENMIIIMDIEEVLKKENI